MILVKTQLGHHALKDRSAVALSPRQRAAFIMIDGRRTVDQILSASQAAGVTADDIDRLVQTGVAQEAGADLPAYAPTTAAELAPLADAAQPTRSGNQKRYDAAYPIACQLTAGLGLRGFRLNLSVEGARTYDDLLALGMKIKEAVGDDKFEPLRKALKN
ncbi:MAG: hypothetical protein JWP22_1640 [Ramlibacter sp.]|jgi:hypothetical protein|nr:hypothetical protein [Ramlibacter sp.]MDB5912965.1 hypothetical protein [Ramlibacter sp.]